MYVLQNSLLIPPAQGFPHNSLQQHLPWADQAVCPPSQVWQGGCAGFGQRGMSLHQVPPPVHGAAACSLGLQGHPWQRSQPLVFTSALTHSFIWTLALAFLVAAHLSTIFFESKMHLCCVGCVVVIWQFVDCWLAKVGKSSSEQQKFLKMYWLFDLRLFNVTSVLYALTANTPHAQNTVESNQQFQSYPFGNGMGKWIRLCNPSCA